MGIGIRTESAGDRSAIWRVNQLAFAGEVEANLVDSLRSGNFVETSLVLETGGETVGHILFTRIAIVTASGLVEALSLAPMAVLPSHQRRGLGSSLVKAGLKACRAGGYGIVVVLGHPKFYSRLGFSSRLAQPLESPFGGGEAWMAAELSPHSVDGLRGRVEYPPPFQALE